MMTFVYNEIVLGKNCFYFLVAPAFPSLSPLVANCCIFTRTQILKMTEK